VLRLIFVRIFVTDWFVLSIFCSVNVAEIVCASWSFRVKYVNCRITYLTGSLGYEIGWLDQDSVKWRPFAVRVMNEAITCLIPTKILCDRFGSVNFSPFSYLFVLCFTLSLISVVSIQTTKYYCVFLKIHLSLARVFLCLFCSGSGSTRMT